MKVSEVMTRNVRIANAEETIQDAARIMAEIDAGVVPVGQEGKLVGMLTDRDIAIRAVAEGLGPGTKVSDVMSAEVMRLRKLAYEKSAAFRAQRNATPISEPQSNPLTRGVPGSGASEETARFGQP